MQIQIQKGLRSLYLYLYLILYMNFKTLSTMKNLVLIIGFLFFSTHILAQVCTPVVDHPCYFGHISNVTIGTINNSSDCSSGYADYTYLSTEIDPDYYGYNGYVPISITLQSNYTLFVYAFVDINDNGYIDNYSEFQTLADYDSNCENPTVESYIAFPYALPGSYLIRIITSLTPMNNYYSYNGCAPLNCFNDLGLLSGGEVEDYTIIIPPPANSIFENPCESFSIQNVTMGTINNNSSCEINGYSDFTAQSTDLVLGTSQSFDVSFNYNTYTLLSVLIDFNDNGTWGDPGEQVYKKLAEAPYTTFTDAFTVPESAAPGSHIMRVIAADFLDTTSICGNFNYDGSLYSEGVYIQNYYDYGPSFAIYGEAEDYTVYITCPGMTVTYFEDTDGDGFGDPLVSQESVCPPVGFVRDNTDCDINNAAFHTTRTWYPDADGDGFTYDTNGDGYPSTDGIVSCGPPDASGWSLTYHGIRDCNDNDAALAIEGYYRLDADGDGAGFGEVQMACIPPDFSGWVYPDITIGFNDCDDNDPAVSPFRSENFFNDTDDNCNGHIDEPYVNYQYWACFNGLLHVSIGSIDNYSSCEGDSYPLYLYDGYSDYTAQSTDMPVGSSQTIETDSIDIYNGMALSIFIDFNSNGNFDNPGERVLENGLYAHNTFQIPYDVQQGSYTMRVIRHNVYLDFNTDPPTIVDICNAYDNLPWSFFGSGEVEDYTVHITCPGELTTYYPDEDGDGFGDPAGSANSFCPTAEFPVTDHTDCDDNDAIAHEILTWYPDADGDGYIYDSNSNGFSNDEGVSSCGAPDPSGWTLIDGGADCNDNDVNYHVTTNWYPDADADGFTADNVQVSCGPPAPAGWVNAPNNTDCDDTNPYINPNASENPYNLLDDDCDGGVDECVPFIDDPCITYINLVILGNIYNSSSCSTETNGYSDFTAQSTEIIMGEQQLIVVGGANFPQYVSVYIDYNNNQGFSDPGEQVIYNLYVPENNTGATLFTIPSSAIPGSHTLRILSQYVVYGTPFSPCTVYYGEAEDYTVIFTCSTTPVTYYPDNDGDGYGDAYNPLTITDCPPAGYISDYTDCDDNDALYHVLTAWYHDADGDGYSDNNIYACGPPDGNWFASTLGYDCNDIPLEGFLIHSGAVEIPGNGVDDNCNGYTDECVPVFANPCISYLTNVTLGDDINISSSCNGSFSDYTWAYAFLAVNDPSLISFTAQGADQYVSVFIDLNNNGVFSDAGEQVVSNLLVPGDGAPTSTTLTIPPGTPLGYPRMRVISEEIGNGFANNPCSGITGEVEDYTLIIFEPCSDGDGDGFTDINCGGTDCDDADMTINPDATEICNGGIDDDCDIATSEVMACNCAIALAGATVAATGTYRSAEMECTDGDWTHYYDEDAGNYYILLSIQKNGQEIGTIGDGIFDVQQNGDMGVVQITNPPANYVEVPVFYVMARYWQVTPNAPGPLSPQISEDVKVRFYFTNEDFTDLQEAMIWGGVAPPASLDHLFFYKINGPYDPDPGEGHVGIPKAAAYDADGYWQYGPLAGGSPISDFTKYREIGTSFNGGYYCEYQVAAFSGGGGGAGVGGSGAFPIELLYFTGHAEATWNVIEWATVTEKNSLYHIIERSTDGITAWTEIGRLDGTGTTTDIQTYQLRDEYPLVESYYRLRAVDDDQEVEISDIIYIERKTDVFALINIFPVPAGKELTLVLNMPASGDLVLNLTDAGGKIVHTATTSLIRGISEVRLVVDNIPAGTYTLCIKCGNASVWKTIVKI